VLSEFKAKGPLTTSLLAVVGLDDALALMIFSITAAFTESLLSSTGHLSLIQILQQPVIEIVGSIGMGFGLAVALNLILRLLKHRDDAKIISIAFIFVGVGLSLMLGLSLILTTMILGVMVVNRTPKHGRYIRYTIEQAGPVIYILFFTLVGARFQINLLPTMGLLGIAYILLRSTGKLGGAWLGGFIGKAEPAVRNNLGFGLLSQAGVAIGLAIAAEGRFSTLGDEGQALGALVVNVIAVSTLFVQIVGPVCLKYAISKAGEVGKAEF
jgi:Kef-type K+ transport system membrane component KefB